jgi:hypothetical protein
VVRLGVLGAIAVVGCYSPRPQLGAPCAPGGVCPDGLVCSQSTRTCEHPVIDDAVLPEAPAIDAPMIDAPPDVIPPDALTSFVFEAEASTSMTATTFTWTFAADVPGYSGTGFMRALPAGGQLCSTESMVITCAPSLVFAFDVGVPDSYYVHARVLASNDSEDSFWYGFDDVVLSAPALAVTVTWTWESTGPIPLAAGAHTFHFWMREDGTRVDRVAITLSPTPPP